ncbi:MAG TPA: hypothetical protein VHE34_00805 [Puia sp.]|uniref:hypothetical protein n=1 Tax=Puia sp. TaxID=2045100 RepID=UPI002C8F67B4|nr:hypothetical protein [Puia sp.]HVU93724.1 hypothetical protein [Puia sp.]
MSHLQRHSKICDLPLLLSEGELKDPISVIKAFFEDYTLSEIREIHKLADHVCLASDFPPFDNAEYRDKLLCYRKGAEKILEAAFLLSQQDKPASPAISPKGEALESKLPLNGEIDLNDLQKRVMDIQSDVAGVVKMVVEAWGNAVDKL